MPILPLLALLLAGSLPSHVKNLGFYEWLGTAPVIVVGRGAGDDGKYTDLIVDEVLRGEVEMVGDVVRILLRRTNRRRDIGGGEKKLLLVSGERYVVLLRSAPRKKPDDPPAYELVRETKSAREMPGEGDAALLDALRRFIEIQDRKDDAYTWAAFAAMLDEDQPVMLETALEQFVKFRRGGPELLPGVRPLLFHPQPGLRERAARMIGQLLERFPDALPPDLPTLRSELVARARRDPAVEVRIAATDAIHALDGPEIDRILREIATSDPDQHVRYAAEKHLFDRGRTARSPQAAGG